MRTPDETARSTLAEKREAKACIFEARAKKRKRDIWPKVRKGELFRSLKLSGGRWVEHRFGARCKGTNSAGTPSTSRSKKRGR